ncbi:MAG: hypothetical protein ACPGQL_10155 [Thermoplasmatota archaeon]
MKAAALTVLVAAIAGGFGGCVACDSLMEVRSCVDSMRSCDPDAADIRSWRPADEAAWPELGAQLDAQEAGRHEHLDFDPAQKEAFWSHWGIDPAEPKKDLYLDHDGQLFHVRLLEC